jgi:hypothetical protein
MIEYNFGGFIATANPKGHRHLQLHWDLLNGDITAASNGRPIGGVLGNETTRAGFKRFAEDFIGRAMILAQLPEEG